MTIRVLVKPVVDALQLEEAKSWCRIDDTNSDGDVRMLIAAMWRYAENLTLRAYVQRTLELILPCWPAVKVEGYSRTAIELPQPPLVQVDSITYIDINGDSQILDADQYVVHAWREPGVIVPSYGVSWPSVRGDLDAVRVQYIAGYAPTGSPTDYRENVPPQVKQWMKARIATLYEHREQLIRSDQVQIPRAFADGLLDDLILGSRIA